jgi:cyclophilin family peptidyl-prolyl cis-trans isomerase
MKKFLQYSIFCIIISKISFAQSSFTGKPLYNILTIQNGDTIGVTKVELFPDIAPLHVANFDSLVNVHFFDTTAFHRVIPGFMIQGGDPNSRHGALSTWGLGDPSQPNVNAEFSVAKHVRGTLSAARDVDTNSANSQFFICVAPSSWLNGDYTVYGRVVSGMNYVDTIVSAPRDSNDNPLNKIEMFITYAGTNDTFPNAPILNIPLSGSYSAGTSRLLKWQAQPDGIIYTLEVATDSLFNNIFKAVNVGINQYNVGGLSQLTKYYWRVKTNNGGHTSNYSEVWNFYVSAVGINEVNASLNNIIVSPNPSSGIFHFTLIDKGWQINITDIQGKLVESVISDSKLASIDLSLLSKGLYQYTITDLNGNNINGKLVVD